MADRSLSFNIAAIDRASKSFEKIALRLDKLGVKLDKLDAKRVNVDVDVDTHGAEGKLRRFERKVRGTASKVGSTLGALPARLRGALIVGLFAAIVAAAPVAGALAASGLVLAFGAGLAVLGIVAAARLKPVRKAFAKLKKDAGKEFTDLGKTFAPALEHVAHVADRLFSSLGPTLKKSLKTIAPVVSEFTDNLASSFKAFAPALKPLSKAFSDILGAIGPRLPGLFAAIADALTGISHTVSKNKELFATLFVGLLHALPLAIRFVNYLAKSFVRVFYGAVKLGSTLAGVAVTVLTAFRGMVNGVLGFLGAIVNGAAKAFGWIPGIGAKLKTAAAGFNHFRGKVNGSFNSMIGKAKGFRTSLDDVPKRLKLTGDIHDLETKIARAKARLKTVPKSKRSTIRANIRDLERKVRTAKRRLASLHNRTVYIHTIIEQSKVNVGPLRGFGAGAAGGPVVAGRITPKAAGGYAGRVYGPGTGTSDTAGLFALSNGEYVVRAAAVKRVGSRFLDAVNRQGYARGGPVTGQGTAPLSPASDVYVTVELDGAPIQARIRAEQADHDRRVRRNVLAGTGARS